MQNYTVIVLTVLPSSGLSRNHRNIPDGSTVIHHNSTPLPGVRHSRAVRITMQLSDFEDYDDIDFSPYYAKPNRKARTRNRKTNRG